MCMCVSAAILDQASTSLSRRTPYTCRYPLARTLDTLFTPCWPKFSHMHFSCCASHAHKGHHLTNRKVGCPNPRPMLSRTLMMGWTSTKRSSIPMIPRSLLVRGDRWNGTINNGLIRLPRTVHLSHQAYEVMPGTLVRSLHRLFLRLLAPSQCHPRIVLQCLLPRLLVEIRHLKLRGSLLRFLQLRK